MYQTETQNGSKFVRTFDMLDIVTAALVAKGRWSHQQTKHDAESNLAHHNVDGFYLKQQPEGWVPCISFRGVPADDPNSIATPGASPFPTQKQAFLAGAEFLCVLLTGSERLPFTVVEDRLMVVGYGTGGFSGLFTMTLPGPWT